MKKSFDTFSAILEVDQSHADSAKKQIPKIITTFNKRLFF